MTTTTAGRTERTHPTQIGEYARTWSPIEANLKHRVVVTEPLDADGGVTARCLDCTADHHAKPLPYRAADLVLLPTREQAHATALAENTAR